MAEIRIRREHALGLDAARRIADEWSGRLSERFGMQCRPVRGEHSDTIGFARPGVDGRLIVAADHFEVEARLGFMLGAFSHSIETEIGKELDRLLTPPPEA